MSHDVDDLLDVLLLLVALALIATAAGAVAR